MKHTIKKFLFFIFIMFIFLNKINADCTFEERQELLKEANNIEAYFDADVNHNIFLFNLYNLNENLYVDITNSLNDKTITINYNNLVNDIYTYEEFEINKSAIYTVNIYSNKSECYGKKITSKRVRKGIINKFAKQSVCEGIEEYYYCNSVLDNNITLTDDEVYKKIEDYKLALEEKNKVEEKNFNLLEFIKKYWFIIPILLGIVLVVLLILYINKKRGELVLYFSFLIKLINK